MNYRIINKEGKIKQSRGYQENKNLVSACRDTEDYFFTRHMPSVCMNILGQVPAIFLLR